MTMSEVSVSKRRTVEVMTKPLKQAAHVTSSVDDLILELQELTSRPKRLTSLQTINSSKVLQSDGEVTQMQHELQTSKSPLQAISGTFC